jgi:hypothetical protein
MKTLTDPPVRRTPSPSSLLALVQALGCAWVHFATGTGARFCRAPEPGVPAPSLALVARPSALPSSSLAQRPPVVSNRPLECRLP